MVLYNAGGGSGRDNLTYNALQYEQAEMFRRTLKFPPIVQHNLDQGERQLHLFEEERTITIEIAREDFLDVKSNFIVTFRRAAPQAAWKRLLEMVCRKLDIENVEAILDRKDNSQVHYTATLRDGGQYLVRQRESASVLETLYTGKIPMQTHWPLCKVMMMKLPLVR
jgi:hypothetical protein